jgi:hypothetical protein
MELIMLLWLGFKGGGRVKTKSGYKVLTRSEISFLENQGVDVTKSVKEDDINDAIKTRQTKSNQGNIISHSFTNPSSSLRERKVGDKFRVDDNVYVVTKIVNEYFVYDINGIETKKPPRNHSLDDEYYRYEVEAEFVRKL